MCGVAGFAWQDSEGPVSTWAAILLGQSNGNVR